MPSDVNRTDTASRLIAAPPDTGFAGLIDPEALATWLPPSGMSGRFERFDPSPGGSYRLLLTYTNLTEAHGKATETTDIVEGRFVEIIPNARIVKAVDFVSADPAFSGTMTITWEIAPIEDKTHVEIRAEHVPYGISAEDHAVGLASSLTNLALYTERQSARPHEDA